MSTRARISSSTAAANPLPSGLVLRAATVAPAAAFGRLAGAVTRRRADGLPAGPRTARRSAPVPLPWMMRTDGQAGEEGVVEILL